MYELFIKEAREYCCDSSSTWTIIAHNYFEDQFSEVLMLMTLLSLHLNMDKNMYLNLIGYDAAWLRF